MQVQNPPTSSRSAVRGAMNKSHNTDTKRPYLRRVGDSPLSKNLKRILDDNGITFKKLSIMSGLNETAVSKIVRGQATDPLISTVSKISDALGIPIQALVSSSASPAPAPRFVPVVGKIAVGHWFEGNMLSQDQGVVPAVPSMLYRSMKQSAWLIDETAKDIDASLRGAYVVTVPYLEARKHPQHGDLVVVERHQKNLTELSLRRVEVSDAGTRLKPQNGNAAFRPIDMPRPSAAGRWGSTRIVGLVVGSYREF